MATKIEEAIKKKENLEPITQESVRIETTRMEYSMPHTYWVTYFSYVGLIYGVGRHGIVYVWDIRGVRAYVTFLQ